MTVGYSGTAAGGVLSIGNGSQAAHIALLGNYLASSFTLSGDGHGGTNVVDPPMLASIPLISNPKGLPGLTAADFFLHGFPATQPSVYHEALCASFEPSQALPSIRPGAAHSVWLRNA